MSLTLDCVEPEILSQIEKETTIITSKVETCWPAMRTITPDYIAWVFTIIMTATYLVFLLTFNFHDDHICLSHNILFLFESFQHGLNRLAILILISYRVYLLWLNPFFDYGVIWQVEVQDNS